MLREFIRVNFGRFIILVIGAGLSACAVTQPGTNYVTEEHLKKAAVAEDAENFFTEYKASIDDPTSAPKAKEYVTRGVNLTRTVCYGFLESMEKRANNVNAGKEFFNVTTVLSTGALALARAGTDAFTGIALGAAFGNAITDIYRDYYLLGPDADAIVVLVKRSMETTEQAIFDAPPATFDIAFANLQSYSKLCTSGEIRRLVRAALKTARPQTVYSGTLSQTQDQIIKDNVAKLLGVSALTDNQILGIYWHTVHGVQVSAHQTIIDGLLGPMIKASLSGKENAAASLLRTLRGATLNRLKQLVEQKVTSATGTWRGWAAPVAAPSSPNMGVIRVEIQ